MKREIKRDATHMKTSCFLVIAADGRLRVTAGAPRLEANEVTMKLSIRVPRALFTKPMMSAQIEIPSDAGNPPYLNAVIVGDIQAAVKQAMGMDLSITVNNQKGDSL